MSILILSVLGLTDILFLVTFMIEPGIIPGRVWGSGLPAKYKSADVRFTPQIITDRIKIRGSFIGRTIR